MIQAHEESEIKQSAYEWSVRFFSIIKKLLRVNIKIHHNLGQLEEGEIFLFNHFARFETFIPQYLIYQETGAYCRSVASAEFFTSDDSFSSYLLNVGAVPNNHPRLITYLAEEILRGQKIIIFPEGGMVKDRRSCDRSGGYSIYSRTSNERRKQHTGAAAISLTADMFKQSIGQAIKNNDVSKITNWMKRLKINNIDKLQLIAERPSTIVPANITFYPMRVDGNILHTGVKLFNRGKLSHRLSEELQIEGNILLKNTDMDIRLGDPIYTKPFCNWWASPWLKQLTSDIDSTDDVAVNPAISNKIQQFSLQDRIRQNARRLRNAYTQAMYTEVTINLSHLASLIIFHLLDHGNEKIQCDTFHCILYMAVKNAQSINGINLHRSLENPDRYGMLLEGRCDGLDQFLNTTSMLGLMEEKDGCYLLMPKLCKQHEFDQIRLENMIEVYANEARPVSPIKWVISCAIDVAQKMDEKILARHRFDDQLRAYRWEKSYYRDPYYSGINNQETATLSGKPFFILPDNHKPMGIVLTHGFLASPAEVHGLALKIAGQGYAVIAPRLKGHGTSPWDLRDYSWKDWLNSVRCSYRIMTTHCNSVCMVGFSTGGALSLLLSAEQPDSLQGVVAVSSPVKFQNRNMTFVPLAHHANKFVSRFPAYEGISPFRPSETEHPNINYHSMPLRSLFELRLMVNELKKRLPEIHCPALIMQGDKDPVVVPESADIIMEKIGSKEKRLHVISSDRHGILYEDCGNAQSLILDYINQLALTMKVLPEKSDLDNNENTVV